MVELFDYMKHSVDGDSIYEAFDIDAGWEDAVKILPAEFNKKILDEIHDVLQEKIWNPLGISETYKINTNNEKIHYFKIHRDHMDLLSGDSLKGTNIEVTGDGVLNYVFKTEKGVKMVKFAVFGNGTNSTAANAIPHELFSAHLFNKYVDSMLNSGSNFDINSMDQVKSESIILTGNNLFPMAWCKSTAAHVKQMEMFIKNASKFDVTQYRAVKVGQKDPILDAYIKFVSDYKKHIKYRGDRNNIDPSDIIIYNANKSAEILSILNRIPAGDNMLKMYKEQIFIPRLIIGVSLKKAKGSSQMPTIFNSLSTDPEYTAPVIKTKTVELQSASKTYNLNCEGTYSFKKTTDPQGEVGDKHQVTVCLRSNTATSLSGVAMDVRFKNKMIAGKVPVHIWREHMYVDPKDYKPTSKGKTELMAAYKEKIDKFLSEKDHLGIIDKFIAAGIKCLPTCMPYIKIE